MQTRLAAALVTVTLLGLAPARVLAGEPPRLIEVRYDMDELDAARALEVWVNCDRSAEAETPRCLQRDGAAALAFELKASDRVLFRMQWSDGRNTRGEIAAAVTGENLHAKDLEALKKMVGVSAASKARDSRAPVGTAAIRTEIKPLTEDLVAGGRLTVTFNVKTGGTDGAEETVTATGGPLTFRVAAEEPRVTVSYGLGFSTARQPEVAIVKSSTIVTFERDGVTQQAYQQVIALRDDDAALEPIQALVTLANFRLWPRTYASAGFQVNQSLFQEPLVGLTYRHPFGRGGLNLTAAVHFSRETEIQPGSGFVDGQPVDPALALTIDDIPVRETYHRRFVLGLSLDF